MQTNVPIMALFEEIAPMSTKSVEIRRLCNDEFSKVDSNTKPFVKVMPFAFSRESLNLAY